MVRNKQKTQNQTDQGQQKQDLQEQDQTQGQEDQERSYFQDINRESTVMGDNDPQESMTKEGSDEESDWKEAQTGAQDLEDRDED